MANQPEERVLILSFDNSDFEKNTKQSIKTLGELDEKLKNTGSANSLKALSGTTKNFNMDGVTNAIDKVNKRFSLMGIAGSTAIAKLTNEAVNFGAKVLTAIPRQIYEGGTRRAQNFEQAKFQLRGLLKEVDKAEPKLNAIMKAAEDAVNGTAYGMDEAARIASQLAASGLQTYEEMQPALQGVAGLAAMTGRSFLDMGNIFAKVAGQGKMTAQELNQIAAGGVNAAQAIGEYVNKNKDVRSQVLKTARASKQFAKEFADVGKNTELTERHIRKAVSAGAISFEIFAAAMNDAFGEQSTKANEQYNGSLDNLRSALSRIGEKTATARLRNMTLIFNALRRVVNQINALLRPMQLMLIKISSAITDRLVHGIDAVRKALEPLTKNASKYVEEIDAFLETRRQKILAYLDAEKKGAQEDAKTFTILEGVMRTFGNALATVRNIVSSGVNIFLTFANILRTGLEPAFRGVSFLSMKLTDGIRLASEQFLKFTEFLRNNSSNAAKSISNFTANTSKGISNLVTKIKERERVNRLYSASTTVLGKAWDGLRSAFAKVRDYITGLDGFGTLKTIFSDLASTLKSLTLTGIDRFTSFLEKIANSKGAQQVLKVLSSAIKTLGNNVKDAGSKLFTAVRNFKGFSDILDKLKGKASGTGAISKLATSVSGLGDSANKAAANIKGSGFIQSIKELGSALRQKIEDGDIGGAIKKVVETLSGIDYSEASKSGLNFAKIFALFTGAISGKNLVRTINTSLAGIGVAITSGIGSISRSLSTSFSKLGGTFDQVTSLVKTYEKRIKIQNFKMIAVSIALIAGAIVALSLIDWKKGWKAAVGVGIVFAALIGVTAMIAKSDFDASKVEQVGIGLAAMAGSILILAFAASRLGKMDWSAMAKAGVAILGFVGVFALITKATKGLGDKTGGSMLRLAAAVTNLVLAIKLLSMMKPETVIKGAAAIAVIVTTLGLASRAASTGLKGGTGFIALATSVNLLVPSVVTLGMMPIEKAIRGTVLVSAMVLALAVAGRIAAGSKKGIGAIAAMSGAMVLLSGALVALSLLPSDKLAIAATALTATMLAFAVASKLAKGALKGVVTMALMITMLSGALILLANMKIESMLATVASLSILAVSMGAAALMFSLINPAGAISALTSLVIFVGGIGLFAAALGALDGLMNGALKAMLEKGIEIGNLIGQFIGSFIGGIGEGITASFSKMAENLSDFVEKLQPFLDGIKGIDPASTEGMQNLANILLTLTKADFLNALGGGQFTGLQGFGDDLVAFASDFKAFAEAAGEIDEADLKAVEIVGKAGNAFAKLAANLPKEGGIWQTFAGYSDLGNFSEDIETYIDAMASAATTASEYGLGDKEIVKPMEKIAKVGQSFAKLANSVPEVGVLQVFTGMNESLATFGADVKAYIGGMTEAANAVSGEAGAVINDTTAERMTKLASVGKSFASMAEALNESKPMILALLGDKEMPDFKDFGDRIKQYVDGVKPALTSLIDVPKGSTEKLSMLAQVAKAMAKVATELKEVKAGEKGQGAGIAKFAAEIKDFVDKVREIEVEGIEEKASSIKKAATELAAAKKQMDKAAKDAAANAATAFNSALSKVKGGSSSAETLQSNVLKGFSTKQFTDAGKKAGEAYLKAISGKTEDFTNAGKDSGKAYVEGITSSNAESAKKLATSAASSLSGKRQSFHSAGASCGEGFVNGVKSMEWSAGLAGSSLGRAAYVAAKAAIESSSPSKKFKRLGVWSGQGMIIGLNSYQSKVYKSGFSLGIKAVEGANDIIDNGFNDPVIRPVLDLSEVRNGARNLSGMVLGNGAMVKAGLTAKAMNFTAPDPMDKLTEKLDKLGTTFSENTGDSINIGDVTLDASKLEDVATVEGFVEILKRAKAFH